MTVLEDLLKTMRDKLDARSISFVYCLAKYRPETKFLKHISLHGRDEETQDKVFETLEESLHDPMNHNGCDLTSDWKIDTNYIVGDVDTELDEIIKHIGVTLRMAYDAGWDVAFAYNVTVPPAFPDACGYFYLHTSATETAVHKRGDIYDELRGYWRKLRHPDKDATCTLTQPTGQESGASNSGAVCEPNAS